MKIPFLDLQAAYRELTHEIEGAVLRALDTGWYALGPEVQEFEQDFARYVGASHTSCVANGLDALYLGLKVSIRSAPLLTL